MRFDNINVIIGRVVIGHLQKQLGLLSAFLYIFGQRHWI